MRRKPTIRILGGQWYNSCINIDLMWRGGLLPTIVYQAYIEQIVKIVGQESSDILKRVARKKSYTPYLSDHDTKKLAEKKCHPHLLEQTQELRAESHQLPPNQPTR